MTINQSINNNFNNFCIFVLTSWFFVIFIQGQRAVGVRRSRVIFGAVFSDWSSNQSILTIRLTGATKLTDITHSGIGLWMRIKKSFVFCVCRFFVSARILRKSTHLEVSYLQINSKKTKLLQIFLCVVVYLYLYFSGGREHNPCPRHLHINSSILWTWSVDWQWALCRSAFPLRSPSIYLSTHQFLFAL